MNKERNVLVVISGPSGVGKGTIAEILTKKNDNMALSISCTTRFPRNGETDGKEYFFIDRSVFEKEIADGGFLEYSEHFGNYYGTPKKFVMDKLKDFDVLLEIDVNGGLNVKKSFPDAILIMVIPPNLKELEARLIGRHTESDKEIELRMQRIDYELEKKQFYDYTVVNDNLDSAVKKIEEIINKEKTIK